MQSLLVIIAVQTMIQVVLMIGIGTKKQSTFGGESEMIIQRGAYYRITK